jgi:hypothetical protein
MRQKNQAKAQVEQKLKEVKDVVKEDPNVRIFVKRIGISVSLEVLKVILPLINFSFLILILFYLEQIFYVWESHGRRGKPRCRFLSCRVSVIIFKEPLF